MGSRIKMYSLVVISGLLAIGCNAPGTISVGKSSLERRTGSGNGSRIKADNTANSAKRRGRTATATPAPAVNSPVNGRGATVPFVELQAEDAQTNATILGPSRTRYDINHIEAEAIGRKAVLLSKTGDFVSFRAPAAGNSVLVRLSIPDAVAGLGIDSTIGVYINGVRENLPVTSRFSWVYGGETLNTPNTPGAEPHTFFDEARKLTAQYNAGAEIKIQRDAQDNAAFYVIDLIDLEQVAPPLAVPADLDSIEIYGAKPNDNIDDGPAIQTALDNLGATGKKGIFIPAGTFIVNDPKPGALGISLKNAQVRGAGMWHSVLKGSKASFFCFQEGNCTFADFAMDGLIDRRDDNLSTNAFNGGVGTGTSMTNLWIDHYKIGMLIGTDADLFGTDGLVVKDCRFRNLYADGVNFKNGTKNSRVENSHFRNTGDDALALFSFALAGDGPNLGNTFSRNTVQMPWRANCFGIYGGGNNTVELSTCEDVLTFPGVMVAQAFNSNPFSPTTTVRDVTITRGGGFMFGQEFGGIIIDTPQGPVNDVVMENIDVVDPTFSGVQFNGNGGPISKVSLKGVNIVNAGTTGILATNNAQGNVTLENVVVTGAQKTALDLQTTPANFLTRLPGNQGF